MRVTKKLAAIGAAMIMAISTVSFTASANENGGNSLDMLNNTESAENANIRVSGTTSLSGTTGGVVSGNVYGTATNKSSQTRPCKITVQIYDNSGQLVLPTKTETRSSLSSGSSFSTSTLSAPQSQCNYAIITASLLTDTGTTYSQVQVSVNFPK